MPRRTSPSTVVPTPAWVTSLAWIAACGGAPATAPAPSAPAAPAPLATAAVTPAPIVAPAPAEAPKPTLVELQRRTLAGFYAAFNEHDVTKLAAFYDAGAVSAAPGPGGWKEVTGAGAVASEFGHAFAAMPDLKVAPVVVFQKNDVAVVEWVASGTNTGEFMGGAPTNKKAAVWGASVYSFNADGLITRDEEFHDQVTIAQQLGKMPGKARPLAPMPDVDPTWITSTGLPDEDKLVDQMAATWPATWNKHDPKAYGAVLTPDVVHSEIASPNDYKGKDANVKELAMYAKALPDMTTTIEKTWAFAPNIVVVEFTFTGTMKGNIGSFKATNKPITIHGLDVDELKDGKLQKARTYTNGLELLAAVGALPKPAGANEPGHPDGKPPAKAETPGKIDAPAKKPEMPVKAEPAKAEPAKAEPM
jgi:steroid delta-isomerase-like uncharacterized protein